MTVRDDRSVSDVLAFVLVFSIIITSVGLVYSVGFSSLSDFQESEQKTNAARAFDAFSSVFDDVEEGRAVARNGELRLRGGTIQLSRESEFNISVRDSGGTSLWNGTNTTGSLLYTADGTTIGYGNGGVFRQDGDTSAMINEPSFLCEGGRAVAVEITDAGDRQRPSFEARRVLGGDRPGPNEETVHESTGGAEVYRPLGGPSPPCLSCVVAGASSRRYCDVVVSTRRHSGVDVARSVRAPEPFCRRGANRRRD